MLSLCSMPLCTTPVVKKNRLLIICSDVPNQEHVKTSTLPHVLTITVNLFSPDPIPEIIKQTTDIDTLESVSLMVNSQCTGTINTMELFHYNLLITLAEFVKNYFNCRYLDLISCEFNQNMLQGFITIVQEIRSRYGVVVSTSISESSIDDDAINEDFTLSFPFKKNLIGTYFNNQIKDYGYSLELTLDKTRGWPSSVVSFFTSTVTIITTAVSTAKLIFQLGIDVIKYLADLVLRILGIITESKKLIVLVLEGIRFVLGSIGKVSADCLNLFADFLNNYISTIRSSTVSTISSVADKISTFLGLFKTDSIYIPVLSEFVGYFGKFLNVFSQQKITGQNLLEISKETVLLFCTIGSACFPLVAPILGIVASCMVSVFIVTSIGITFSKTTLDEYVLDMFRYYTNMKDAASNILITHEVFYRKSVETLTEFTAYMRTIAINFMGLFKNLITGMLYFNIFWSSNQVSSGGKINDKGIIQTVIVAFVSTIGSFIPDTLSGGCLGQLNLDINGIDSIYKTPKNLFERLLAKTPAKIMDVYNIDKYVKADVEKNILAGKNATEAINVAYSTIRNTQYGAYNDGVLYIVTRDADGTVYVTFRGTAYIVDVITDASLTIKNPLPLHLQNTSSIKMLDNVKVAYQGLNIRTTFNFEPIETVINNLIADTTVKSIVFTGHSMGAALSALVCSYAISDRRKTACSRDIPIHYMGFSPLSFSNTVFNKYLTDGIKKTKGEIYVISTYQDAVPSIVPYEMVWSNPYAVRTGKDISFLGSTEVSPKEVSYSSLFGTGGKPIIVTDSTCFNYKVDGTLKNTGPGVYSPDTQNIDPYTLARNIVSGTYGTNTLEKCQEWGKKIFEFHGVERYLDVKIRNDISNKDKFNNYKGSSVLDVCRNDPNLRPLFSAS